MIKKSELISVFSNTSRIFLLESPFPYGFEDCKHSFLNGLDNAFEIDVEISDLLYSQSITLTSLYLSACLLPRFTAGFPNVGASKIPLEEFPIINSQFASSDI